VIYWQKSLESLAQKVIVGDSVLSTMAPTTANAAEELRPALQENGDENAVSNQQQESQSDDGEPADEAMPNAGAVADQEEDDEDAIIADAESVFAEDNSILCMHDANLFRLACDCRDCSTYRETVIQLYIEDYEYNTLWERLQLLIKKFYDLIPE
jgi:hypothetical protein